MYGKIFGNSEQIYQWCRLRFSERNDLAAEVLRCKTAKQVKNISNKTPHNELAGWDSQKLQNHGRNSDCKITMLPKVQTNSTK